MTIEVGSRVACEVNKKTRVGTVMRTDGQAAHVIFDDAEFKKEREVALPLPFMYPISNLVEYKRGMTLKETTKPPLQLFLQTNSNKFDVWGARAMWAWANFHLFHNELSDFPELLRNFRSLPKAMYDRFKGATGLCIRTPNKKVEIVLNTRAMINTKAMWATLVHEMVHQYCFQHGTDDGHGPNFFKWADAVQSICRVPLNKNHDIDRDEVRLENEPEDAVKKNKGAKPFYVLLVTFGGVYQGIASEDLVIIKRIKSNMGLSQTWIREVRGESLRSYFNFAKRVEVNRKQFKLIPSDLATQIIHDDTYRVKETDSSVKDMPAMEGTERLVLADKKYKFRREGCPHLLPYKCPDFQVVNQWVTKKDLEIFPCKEIPVKKIIYTHARVGNERVRYYVKQIKQNHGKLEPILVSKRHGKYYIFDGHHRTEAAEHLGMTCIPAYVAPHKRLFVWKADAGKAD